MSRRAQALLLGLTGLDIDGGIASVSRCVVRALGGEVAAGRIARADRVLLLDDTPPRSQAEPGGGELFSRGSQPRFVWQLWRSYLARRPDLVFFDHVGLARATRVPLPGFPPANTAIFCHGTELAVARSGSRARALRGARRLLANSEATARTLREIAPQADDRLRVVPLCIDPQRVEAWERRPERDGPRREPAVLIVGRMVAEEPGKGHAQLIAAWPEVKRRVPAAELWIVGGGDDVTRHREAARASGMQQSVRFLGRVPEAQLADLYRRASIFAMPSRQEGFGLVYAEAMWHGLPCIGSTADAAREVIDDGATGALVPYGDVSALTEVLAGLLANPDRAARMGEAGAKRARTAFAYARFRSDLLAALELGGPRSAAPAGRDSRESRVSAG